MKPAGAQPVLALSIGDPAGIGPEIVVRALADPRVRAGPRVVVHGEREVLARAARGAGVALPREVEIIECAAGAAFAGTSPLTPGAPSAASGAASLAYFHSAIQAVKAGEAAGIVTAPISKEAWALAGAPWPGHTELLAHEFASPRSGMLFVGPALRVILASVHVPLRRVPEVLTSAGILEKIELGDAACRELGVARPRIAVAGLNPHAGEHGLLGREDDAVIAPAVQEARARGIDAHGPLPGDTVFGAAAKGAYDLIVAMYHDQGLIPVKLLDQRRSVNVTVGLRWPTGEGGRRVVRTSPAHGTAYDIAQRFEADATSMVEAILLAARLAPSDVR